MSKKREDNNVYKKLNEHSSEISNIQKEITELKKDITALNTTRNTLVAQDLDERTPGFRDSYMFTYRQISERHGIPMSQVQKVAKENGLERINGKKIG